MRGGLIIDDAMVVSPEQDVPFAADVHILDGKIAAIAPQLQAGPGTRIIDARGQFVVPGLIDSHVHVGHPIGLSDEQIETYPEMFAAYLKQVPRSYLYFGFTTLIDLDLNERSRKRFENAPIRPRLFSCGRGVRQPAGYGPALFSRELRYKIFPEFVWDVRFADELPPVDPKAYTPEAVVARIAEGGAICIKTYVEPGFGGVFDWPTPSHDTLVALRVAAHSRKLPFVVHATGTEGWRAAIDAGADVIAHGLWHWDGDRLRTELSPTAQGVIADAVAARTRVQPTMQVLHGEHSTFIWDLSDPRLAHVLPPAFLTWLRTDEAQWSRRRASALYKRVAPTLGHPDTPHARFLEAADARVAASTRRFQDAGGRLLFGSDTPAEEGIGNPPGLNGLREIERWAAAGISPASIFTALTLRNAEAFGLHDSGKVAVGMRADLLLLRADPRETIAAYDTITTVIVSGQEIERGVLSASAGAVQ